MAATQFSANPPVTTTSPYRPGQSQSPPLDLSSYSRALLHYTQRQMEGLRSPPSRGEAASGDKSASPPTSAPNGIAERSSSSGRRRRSPTSPSLRAAANLHNPVPSEFGYRE